MITGIMSIGEVVPKLPLREELEKLQQKIKKRINPSVYPADRVMSDEAREEKRIAAEAIATIAKRSNPFDFSRQQELLSIALSAAVPLWIGELLSFRSRTTEEDFWDHCGKISREAAEAIASQGDALMFKTDGVTAKVFNLLAKGIAVMSFCPGGVKTFGGHWEIKE